MSLGFLGGNSGIVTMSRYSQALPSHWHSHDELRESLAKGGDGEWRVLRKAN
jgi:hypothetical protein